MPRQMWAQIKGWPVFLVVALIATGGIAFASWSFNQPPTIAINTLSVLPTVDYADGGAQTWPDPDDDEIDPQGDEDDQVDKSDPADREETEDENKEKDKDKEDKDKEKKMQGW